MAERAHIIEIDSIVLDGVDPRGPGILARVEAETRRAIRRAGFPDSLGVAGSEVAVAREVARTVDHAIKGGPSEA